MTEPTPRTISELLRDIAGADVRRGVYRVSLVAAAHTTGFNAVVEMRGNHVDGYGGFTFHADTPEVALEGVELELLAALGRCPECGNFREGKTT
jgi:hypothetical protein